uniref:Uncharacterized protein n=1 Tax=Arundo donax TaxID=35708 RepID=A0A0A9LZS2_ARUDO
MSSVHLVNFSIVFQTASIANSSVGGFPEIFRPKELQWRCNCYNTLPTANNLFFSSLPLAWNHYGSDTAAMTVYLPQQQP